jgi:hypothetical protein
MLAEPMLLALEACGREGREGEEGVMVRRRRMA